MIGLSAGTCFRKGFDTCLENIMVAHVCPPVPHIILFHLRNIHKSVIVAIMRLGLIFVMRQQRSAPSFGKFQCSVRIGFIPVSSACKKIGRHPIGFRQLWFLKFYVYLSCDGFITILHRRCSFGNLYALHPRTGDISQSIRSGGSPIIRNIFRQHLHISAGQPQQFNLFGSCCRIGITHIY